MAGCSAIAYNRDVFQLYPRMPANKMTLTAIEIKRKNEELRNATPAEIIEFALSLNKSTILTTSFGFYSAVSLHALTSVTGGQEVPVIWVDSGYNVRDAYQAAEAITEKLGINLKVYNPLMSSERRNALMGGVPASSEPLFDEFVRQVKLEPFERALNDYQPEVWISGIRQEETEHRKQLDILSVDSQGILKVSPLFYLKETDLQDYIEKYELPNCKHYFDPTKVQDDVECGLHTFTPKAS